MQEKKMYQYKIKKINRVIDGDTVEVDIDLGFGLTYTRSIRLKDIDAPEIRTKDTEEQIKGIESKHWLENILLKEGDWRIDTYKSDKYGRILGVLYIQGEKYTVNERMIAEGYAKPYYV